MGKLPQTQISQERYKIITARYEKYLRHITEPSLEPIKVFDPLAKELLDELELIRTLSKTLQDQKDEHIKNLKEERNELEKKEEEQNKSNPEENKVEKT